MRIGSINCKVEFMSADKRIVPSGTVITTRSAIANTTKRPIKDGVFGLTIEDASGKTVFKATTEEKLGPICLDVDQRIEFKLVIDNIFADGEYIVDVAFVSMDRSNTYARYDEAAQFGINGKGKNGWLLNPKYSIEVIG